MDTLAEAASLDEANLLSNPPPNFGQLLRSRREDAGLTIAALAAKAGVTRNTIVNLEQGLTAPNPQTIRRLVAVKSLRLSELAKNEPTTEAWFTEAYNPMAMTRGMGKVLNGPGGQIEQTYWYLDPQSACDWYTLSNSEQYLTAYRSTLPLAKVAERVLKESKGVGIDVDGLGCGDGKSETEFMQRLADLMPSPPDLQLYLLDISHVLLSEAYRSAINVLAPRRIPVFAVHGNFHDVSKNPQLYMHPISIKRLRVFLMLGCTVGNINDEQWFFRDLAACAEPGDLVVLDCQLTRAPVEQPDMIRALDIPIRTKRPAEPYIDFLAGPLRRHCRGLKSLRLRTDLSLHCAVPGSYTLEYWADVEKDDEPTRQFLVFRNKRYDIVQLSDYLQRFGWTTLQTWKYGPDKLAAVLLIQRQ